ncbi:MAG TPA: hypothetical protein VHY32_04865 [Caulobacteraceae bacterium]|jgi:hypothetical protein|nr:hypothetical protein [Caulobacteraceae bacterium]
MDEATVLERAYALARSGKCRSIKDVRDALKVEGFNYETIAVHLHGLAVTRDLTKLCKTSWERTNSGT